MSAHLAYIAILSFVLVSWAHPVIESFTPRKSSVVALRRRNAQYSVHQDSAAGRYILFNLNFAVSSYYSPSSATVKLILDSSEIWKR